MSGALRACAADDLQISTCAFPMCRLRSWSQLCCCVSRPTTYATTLSLGILLTLKVKLVMQSSYPCIHSATIYSSIWFLHTTPLSFTERVGNGVTSLRHTVRLVLLSSYPSPPLMYFHIPLYGPLSSTCTSISSFPCTLSYLIPHVWLVQWNSLPLCLYFHRFSSYPNLLMIFPCFPLRYPLLDIFPPLSCSYRFSFHVLFASFPHSLLTPPPFRRRLLRIVLRFLGNCRRAGLFAATTLSRFWNSVATNAWLGLALVVACAFYAVFASPSQDKLSGFWGGCSFTFHQCFTFLRMKSHCLRVYLAFDFSQNSISYEILN